MSKLAIHGGTPVRTTPFPKWPIWNQEEINAVTEVVNSGKWGSLHGDKTSTFEKLYAEAHDAKFGTAIVNGTAALRIALMAAGIGAGDEVLVPAYTFIASATAVIEAGGVPIFVDIDPATYNIDSQQIAAAITPRTRAVMPVHFGGRPADLDAVMEIAKKHNLIVIEDAAQAWGSSWRGRKVGAIGAAGGFSFQSSKNITAGEGGIILTNDENVARMMRSHYNCGRSETGLWYEHYFFGTNLRLSELQSAILLVQFKRYPELLARRQKLAQYLTEQLQGIEGVELMQADPRVTSNSIHLFIWRYKKAAFHGLSKTKFLDLMKAEGIQSSAGYSLPLYKQPVFKQRAFGPAGRVLDLGVDYNQVYLPESEKACFEEAIWFNQNQFLGTEADMDDIVTAIKKIRDHASQVTA
ncbi:DegT/DnrJ/EryC1/StrS family aminotransferase [candidate division KSB1 bacterium]|nr:DegT/DnrJ/EryC1/StrS family aminotransferase [candidate division KSB1 bacterium]